MFFAIFNGISRGVGNKPAKEVYLKVGVDFRNYLKYFKGAKLAIFMAICLHMDERGRCFPSYDTLMELTGLNRATVAKAVKELQTTLIDGQPVLGVSRERDEKGRLKGNNHYCLFPTLDEVQSLENPTLEKPNYQKPILEEELYVKEEPIRKNKENGGGNSSLATDNPSPAPLPTAAVTEKDSTEQRPTATEIVTPILKELEAAKRQQAQEYQSNESAILKAFEALNQSIRAGRNPYNPITGTKQLAEKLAARGETEATMKAAWDTCKANGIKPMGAFMKWIQDGYLPPQQAGQETKVFNGTIHVWTDDGGWTDTGRKAV